MSSASSGAMAMSSSSEYSFSCDKCPRSFKLREFYEKHKKVHELKKQHACDVCGYVYGAAKGLEGHLKTHSEEELAAVALKQMMMSAAARPPMPVIAAPPQPQPQLAHGLHALPIGAPPMAAATVAHLAAAAAMQQPHINFHFLHHPQGVLAAQQPMVVPAATVSPQPHVAEVAPTGSGNYKIYGKKRQFFHLRKIETSNNKADRTLIAILFFTHDLQKNEI